MVLKHKSPEESLSLRKRVAAGDLEGVALELTGKRSNLRE
jgi:hypothetical protein